MHLLPALGVNCGIWLLDVEAGIVAHHLDLESNVGSSRESNAPVIKEIWRVDLSVITL